VTGLHRRYDVTPHAKAVAEGRAVGWLDILRQWPLVEADLHEVYGLDVGDDALMRARSWRWLRTRILGLLSADTRLCRHFTPET
jgi:hypothetical protein